MNTITDEQAKEVNHQALTIMRKLVLKRGHSTTGLSYKGSLEIYAALGKLFGSIPEDKLFEEMK